MSWPAEVTITEIVFALIVFGNVISGIDDLAIDVYYWVIYLFRRLRYPRGQYPQLTEEDLDSVIQKKAAIFIAAWDEADVIEDMLLCNSELIDYQNYEFFVACYPNDKATQEKIDAACRVLPNVHKAVNRRRGPSNKADNLNAAFAELVRQEQISGKRYDFIVMHDPEDVLHPLELKLCNYLMTRRGVNMVQTPVFPIEVPARNFTAGSYMDDFAETHTKDIYAREWARAFVPSAGVGTAIARDAFDRLGAKFGEKVFNTESLTEDYDFSLRLDLSGYKSIFVRQRLLRRCKQKTGKADESPAELIATRAHFPATFKTAVRQRTRWMVGINFQNWKQVGWEGRLQTKWMLFHDRKAVWSNSVLMFNYLFAAYGGGHWLYRACISPETLPLLPYHRWIGIAIAVCMGLMLNRVLQRVIASTRTYGIRQGLLSIPRLFWGNVINIAVTARAVKQFLTSELSGTRIAWDKTAHYFPSGMLTNQRGLGDALVNAGRLTLNHLDAALRAQPSTEWSLENALLELRSMVEADIRRGNEQRAAAPQTLPWAAPLSEPETAPQLNNVRGQRPEWEPTLTDLLLGRRQINPRQLSRFMQGEPDFAFGD